jgi:hypothetical protein
MNRSFMVLMSLVKSPIAVLLHLGNMQAQAISRPDIRFMFDADRS